MNSIESHMSSRRLSRSAKGSRTFFQVGEEVQTISTHIHYLKCIGAVPDLTPQEFVVVVCCFYFFFNVFFSIVGSIHAGLGYNQIINFLSELNLPINE